MKKLVAMLLVLSMVFMFVGCGSSAPANSPTGGASDSGKEPYLIGVSVPTVEMTFFAKMQTELKAKYPNERVVVEFFNSADNQEKQNKDVEDMIAKGMDGIVIIPITVEGAVPAIQYANEKNVPVITVDRQITEDADCEVLGFVGSDHKPMGVGCAELLVEGLEKMYPNEPEWIVVELTGTPGSSAAIDRGAGIHEVLDPIDKVTVKTFNGEFLTTTATNIAADVLISGVDGKPVHAFACHNDMMAEGVYQALVNAKMLDKVVVTGIDGQMSTVQKVADGEIAGTVLQYPAMVTSSRTYL